MDSINYVGVGGGIAGMISLVIGILVKLNHKRCRSKCCGRDMIVSVDVEETTPNLQIPVVRDDEPVKLPCKA